MDEATADRRRFDGGQLRSVRGGQRARPLSSGDVNVSPLGRLVRETRGRLHAMHDLWRLLPEQVCDQLTVTTFDNTSLCWNGRSYRSPAPLPSS